MEKIVLALGSLLTTCLLLLQCYSILGVKIMMVNLQLIISRWKQYCQETMSSLGSKKCTINYIVLEAVLSRSNAISRLKKNEV